MNIDQYRPTYYINDLTEDMLAADPVVQLAAWLEEAKDIPHFNAMQLATASRTARPSVRTVLLKDIDEGKLVFYTNKASLKGAHLAENPQAEVVFLWTPMMRQVRVYGAVSTIPKAVAAAYFATRPRGSQVAASVSAQSAPIEDWQTLYARQQALMNDADNAAIPVPADWQGYALTPETVEFWQGRDDRLHYRYQYQKTKSSDTPWRIQTLQP